jgi:hypothetical protein
MASDRERIEPQDPYTARPSAAERNPTREDIRSIADERGGGVDEEPGLEELDEDDVDDDLDDEEDLDEDEEDEEEDEE